MNHFILLNAIIICTENSRKIVTHAFSIVLSKTTDLGHAMRGKKYLETYGINIIQLLIDIVLQYLEMYRITLFR